MNSVDALRGLLSDRIPPTGLTNAVAAHPGLAHDVISALRLIALGPFETVGTFSKQARTEAIEIMLREFVAAGFIDETEVLTKPLGLATEQEAKLADAAGIPDSLRDHHHTLLHFATCGTCDDCKRLLERALLRSRSES